jgi:delta24-sterol reductase
MNAHEEKVKNIVKQLKDYHRTKSTKKIRFAHGSTNSTRVQDKSNSYIINIASLNEILNIDTKKLHVTVEPNVPMDKLVDACLKKNVLPKVVMEFPGITVGGGVNGGALESSSYKYGQFNDTCLAYECMLGDGSVINADKKQNSDLYYGISGTYGSLALLTKITISLIPAKQFVLMTLMPTRTDESVSNLEILVKKKVYDYLDCIIFDKNHAVIIGGKLTNERNDTPITFSKPNDEWFYLFVKKNSQKEHSFSVPIKDFLFRYDRGAFWMGESAFKLFHVPFSKIFRRMLNPMLDTRTMYKALHKSNAAQLFFIQDFYIPLSQTNKFLDYTIKETGIFPIWLCPIKSAQTPQYLSPHFLKEPMLIDVGIWGSIPENKDLLKTNKQFETFVQKIDGRKMFYAEVFYTEDLFWKIYDLVNYQKLRRHFKAEKLFPSVYEKVLVKKKYPVRKKLGVLKTLKDITVTRSFKHF